MKKTFVWYEANLLRPVCPYINTPSIVTYTLLTSINVYWTYSIIVLQYCKIGYLIDASKYSTFTIFSTITNTHNSTILQFFGALGSCLEKKTHRQYLSTYIVTFLSLHIHIYSFTKFVSVYIQKQEEMGCKCVRRVINLRARCGK
jgi:hypothetical protein